ncbi:MAG: GMC oxidoreductase, partial [Gaiellaceae bacterium]
CVRCDRFDGFPCLTDGKADSHVVCVRPALKHPNVTLLTHARVERLDADASGRSVRRVVVDRGGREETYSADIVVVSGGAVNSAALLLRSVSDKHPGGLANSSGVVGRHYMAHLNSAVIAISRAPNETRFQKTLGLNDYYWGAADSDLPLGHIQMLGKSDRNILRTAAPRFAPRRALDYLARHSLDFWLTTEDLPDPRNRVTLDRHGSIHLAKTEHNTEPHKRLLAKLEHLLVPLGCHAKGIRRWSVLSQHVPIAGIAHNCGTVRFGTDPRQSALDADCKAHDLDNLYVVDTSFFPSSSAVNPGLTAMANALRVGDHLLERLGTRSAAGRRHKRTSHAQVGQRAESSIQGGAG